MNNQEKYQAVKSRIQELCPELREGGFTGVDNNHEPRLNSVISALIKAHGAIETSPQMNGKLMIWEMDIPEKYVYYSLADDRLSQQSEETINFLAEILGV